MAWSLALLDDEERVVFRRRAVFSGAFSHGAVETVCGGSLAMVGRLVDMSLVSIWREGTARCLDDVVAALTRGRGPRHRPQIGWASLTPTELDIVRLIREGLSSPEIASRPYMSRATVKAHLTRIYAKLGAAQPDGAGRDRGRPSVIRVFAGAGFGLILGRVQ
ncbi:MAG TPA: LuxR C-terminal-related transcriptional regulator [Actinophytocola sp.]|uniref:helix-turn-helix transcriptional regulator n=1 Tax=Actinophytocola sp. TaxID=1872138 RepID=UPI002E02FFD8|nr:LuxR C-terminal-related transcriptional regulator [Actinophytocola sp.]